MKASGSTASFPTPNAKPGELLRRIGVPGVSALWWIVGAYSTEHHERLVELLHQRAGYLAAVVHLVDVALAAGAVALGHLPTLTRALGSDA